MIMRLKIGGINLIMFKKAYAVVVDSYIDGGAPGYYAVAICETQEEADKIKSFVNSCLNTIKNSKIGTRKRWEATRYLEKFYDYEISFGYNEGADSNAYIKEITILQDGDFEKIYYKFKEGLKESRERYAKEHDGKIDYSDWQLC